jgi:16S rRNA (guanine527-N7)-methyltransferase
VEKTQGQLELDPSLKEVCARSSMQILLKYFPDLTPQQLKQFGDLEKVYKHWNTRINVISRKDIDNLYEKHVLHSLSIAAVFDFAKNIQIIDIGTGGGFPGIPLAIFFPEAKFYLVDSMAKKLKVVEAIVKDIGLKNITTEHTRVEEVKGWKFDFAVSRAVAPLKDLWKWSKPLLKNPESSHHSSGDENPKSVPGLICLKGGDLSREISESATRPRIIEISDIFPENYFKEKYILYISTENLA